jgi:hypothetical protein
MNMDEYSRRHVTKRSASSASPIELLVLAIALIAVVVAAAGSTEPAHPVVRTASVRVHSGDCVWSLAEANPVDGLSTAQTAQLIIQLNDGHSTALAVGGSVLVPIEGIEPSVAMR